MEPPGWPPDVPLLFEDDIVCKKDKPACVGIVLQAPPSSTPRNSTKNVSNELSDSDEDGAAQENGGPVAFKQSPFDSLIIKWVSPKLETSKEHCSALRILDRPFLHGDIVARIGPATHPLAQPQTQLGRVVGVNVFVDLEMTRSKEKLFGVPTHQISTLHPFLPGRFVISNGWVGSIEQCLCDLTMQFSDGAVCHVARSSLREIIPCELESDELDALLEADRTAASYFPGQKVRAAPSVWTAAQWIRGQYNNKKHRDAVVVFVQPSQVAVHWYTTWLSGDRINPPNVMCSPAQIQVLDHYSYTRMQVGDHVLVDWANLRAAHKKPPTSFRCPPNPLVGVQLQLAAQHQHQQQQQNALSRGGPASSMQHQKGSQTAFSAQQNTKAPTAPSRPSSMPSLPVSDASAQPRSQGRFNFGFQKIISSSSQPSVQTASPSTLDAINRQQAQSLTLRSRLNPTNAKLTSALLEKEKKKRQKDQIRNCACILRSYTLIDVQWQDATVELHQPSFSFQSKLTPSDFFPEDLVTVRPGSEWFIADEARQSQSSSSAVDSSSSAAAAASPAAIASNNSDGSKPSHSKVGVVLRVDASERLCEVRWLDHGEIQQVSSYILMKHPDFDFCLGDVVIRIPSTEPSSSHAAPSSPKTSIDLSSPPDSVSSGIGQIVDIFDGRGTVLWSDGVQTTVFPDSLFVVREADYEEEDEDQSSSAELLALDSTLKKDDDDVDAAEEEEELDQDEEAEEDEDEEDEEEQEEVDEEEAEDDVEHEEEGEASQEEDAEDQEEEEEEEEDDDEGNGSVSFSAVFSSKGSRENENGSPNKLQQSLDAPSAEATEAEGSSSSGEEVPAAGSFSTASGSRASSLRRKGARKAQPHGLHRPTAAPSAGRLPSSEPLHIGHPVSKTLEFEDDRRHSRDEDEEIVAAIRAKTDARVTTSASPVGSFRRGGVPSSPTKSMARGSSVFVSSRRGTLNSNPDVSQDESLEASEASASASQSQSDSMSRFETASDRAKQIARIKKRMEAMRLLGSPDEDESELGALSESSSDDIMTQDQLDDDDDIEEGFLFPSHEEDEESESASASASASLSAPGDSLLSTIARIEGIPDFSSDASFPHNGDSRSCPDSGIAPDGHKLSSHSHHSGHRRSPSNVPLSILESLRPIVQSLPHVGSAHRYISRSVIVSSTKQFHKVLRHEIKLLRTCAATGIWVNTFDDRSDLLSALIAGPCGTPYFLSLHVFDIFIDPNDYPSATAPEIFYHCLSDPSPNPFLNQDGSICLSLLTLWNRRNTDTSRWWNPDQANLSQVLLSIQGLILGVQYPFFLQQNVAKKTKDVMKQAQLFNENALLLSLQHIIRLLSNPPAQFTGLVRDYYRVNRDPFLKLADLLIPLACSNKKQSNQGRDMLSTALSEIPAANSHVKQFGILFDPPPTQGFLIVFERLMARLRPLLTNL